MQPQIKPNKFKFFLDTSGSVGGSSNYYDTVQEILKLYADDIDTFYEWNTQIVKLDRKSLDKLIEQKIGHGGTSPQLVASEVIKNGYESIILITDGQVGDNAVRECDRILQKHKFATTICYIISTSCGQVDLSVTCPFTRNCENKVFKKLSNSPIQVVVQYTPQDYKILDTLDTITLENFAAQYNLIEGLVIALNMGKSGNIPLKNQLVVMKKRLLKELSKKKSFQSKNPSQILRQFLQKNDFNSAIEQARIMSEDYFKDDISRNLEKDISHLINLCGDLTGKYNINQIKSNRMGTAVDVQQGEIDKDIDVSDLSKNLIECPILNEQDVPQILIDEGQPILLGEEKFVVDDIVSCPLRILNYPQVKAKLKARLSNYVGVMGIKLNFNQDLKKNPFTQKRLLGSIPLGTHYSHVKVGNATLAKLISGGKILGNLNLFYAVIWYLIQEGSIEYLKDIEKNAQQHLIFRLKTHKSYASLCGQAQFVTTQVHTDVAIWYCANSGFLNMPTDKDTFRFHITNIEPMVKIIQVLGYPYDKGLMAHYNRTRTLLSLLSVFKKLETQSEKKSFKNMLLGLYQNGILINEEKIHPNVKEAEILSTFVPLDGPASEEQILRVRQFFTKKYPYTQKFSNEELFYLGELVDVQKSASAYFLNYNMVIPPLPEAKVHWAYGLKKYDVKQGTQLKFSPITLRPYYEVNKNSWENAAENKYGIKPHELFSGVRYYQDFVKKHKKLPNYDELITYYYNRSIEVKKTPTLPYFVQEGAIDLIKVYGGILQKLKIDQIINTLNKYRSISIRTLAEKQKDPQIIKKKYEESIKELIMSKLNLTMISLE